MSLQIHSIIPDGNLLFAMDPEELAAILMQCINALPQNLRNGIKPKNLFKNSDIYLYRAHNVEDIEKVLMEAWICLARDGFVAPIPGNELGWYFITRKGEQIANASDLDTYRKANLLPKQLLHPRLALKVWPAFARGEYDTAVFQAFKEVEVAVRDAGSFALIDLGVDLMRQAFKPNVGPLTDTTVPEAEQLAVANLFAGAIGSYKNPGSHRHISLEDPTDAVELVFLASHLLRIVEARGKLTSQTAMSTSIKQSV